MDFNLGEEVTEALFTVGQAVEGQADFLGLGQHFLGQVALDEVPVMILTGENIGQGQEDALHGAVLVQSECGDADDVDRGVAAQDVGKDGLLIAHDAAGLDVDHDVSAGQLFQLLFESQSHVTNDRTFDGVDFRIGQGNRLCGSRHCADCKNHAQGHQKCQGFFHFGFLLNNFGFCIFLSISSEMEQIRSEAAKSNSHFHFHSFMLLY